MHGFFFIHGKDFSGEMWVSFLNKGYLLQSNIKPNHFVLQSLSRKITQTISPNKFAKAIKTEKKSRDLQYRAFLAATWLIDCESRGIFMRRRSLWWLSSSPQKYFDSLLRNREMVWSHIRGAFGSKSDWLQISPTKGRRINGPRPKASMGQIGKTISKH